MDENFEILSKNSKKISKNIGDHILLDGLIKDLLGPKVVSNLVYEKDKKRFLDELKRCKVSFSDKVSSYNSTYNLIKIKKEHFEKYISQNNKCGLKESIGEEVAHLIASKKEPEYGGNLVDDNLEEYYGRLGSISLLSKKELENTVSLVKREKNLRKLIKILGDSKKLYNLYDSLKGENGCKKCDFCLGKGCKIHRDTITKLNKLVRELEKSFLNKEEMKHLFGYALADSAFEKHGDLKKLFNVPKEKVKEVIKKRTKDFVDPMILEKIKKDISSLDEDPKIYEIGLKLEDND